MGSDTEGHHNWKTQPCILGSTYRTCQRKDVGSKGKKGVRTGSSFSGLRNWMNGGAITWRSGGNECHRLGQEQEENQGFYFEYVKFKVQMKHPSGTVKEAIGQDWRSGRSQS